MSNADGYCKACLQRVHAVYLVNGYCPGCSDELRELVDEFDANVKPLDGDSYDDAHVHDEGGES